MTICGESDDGIIELLLECLFTRYRGGGGPGRNGGAQNLVSRGGGRGGGNVVQRGAHKKKDYHKYSGKICQIL